MSYFKYFPKVEYSFGDGETALMQNITAYNQVLDEISDTDAFYTDFYIRYGMRPDQVAYALYGNPNLHWILFLINPSLRECGWPLTKEQLQLKLEKDFGNFTITTRDPLLVHKMQVGQRVLGMTTGALGTIIHRNLDMGQLVVQLDNPAIEFSATEMVQSSVGEVIHTIMLSNATKEYLSTKEYTNGSGDPTYVDPTQGPGEFVTEVTYKDFYERLNDDLRQIRVIKPSNIRSITTAFRDAMR